MKKSSLIENALFQIHSVKGKKLSLQERQDLAISLAAKMLKEAQYIQTKAEKRQQAELAGMMNDSVGKIFTTALTDQCFRSLQNSRVADQLAQVIHKYGIPIYLSDKKRLALKAFRLVGKILSSLAVPITIRLIQKETRHIILPGEPQAFAKHMKKRCQEGVRINLNHLGEAILGEEEARRRLQIYLDDLANPLIECISIKISTIYSQIHLLAWEETLEILSERLRLLYRAAIKNKYRRATGEVISKFVNLDMEEYRDLNLTVALFKKVLDEPEFFQYQGGIVLQSYLPDSYLIQQELTQWAMQRVNRMGAPIKIRLVKGANLAMEQFESAVRLWPQAPYTTKADVDANYKRMVTYGCEFQRAQAAHLGIASHNLFDIAYALLLRSENQIEKEVCFEMLEGMADHIRRVVQTLADDMLLYCPTATKEEFQNAVAYLVRRLDENTAPENFLRHAFDLKPGTDDWNKQVHLFKQACQNYKQVSDQPRRLQNRLHKDRLLNQRKCFQNVADTDWSLSHNRQWAKIIIDQWKNKKHLDVPLVINDFHYTSENCWGIGEDPSFPGKILYRYALASQEQVDEALDAAQNAYLKWSATTPQERANLLIKIAQGLELHRADLIGAMIADTAKTLIEADIEVSEAIDFANYYRFNLLEWMYLEDVKWCAKGVVVIAPPWNFPCSIAAGGILAALVTGNTVILKPAVESVLVCWHLAQIFWEAGISQQVLQFVVCEDEPVGSALIQDSRVNAVVLTGATETAKLFLRLRANLDLMAETGGKNTMIITSMADRDLAIKDLVQSAFSHAGQKCSACSLAIVEAEIYDNLHFRQQLKDSVESLSIGSPWKLKSKVNPLIREANPNLLRGLTQLEEGEEWLVQPKQDSQNPYLWSPGIKLGVKPGNFTYNTELFGPVLGLVRAENFDEALHMMNQTGYGLTAGIHTLDEREQNQWFQKIEAGNCYINRTMTGAIVERQPFGGCKESSFGKGSKAGGPNYLVQFMQTSQKNLPTEQKELKEMPLAFLKNVRRLKYLSSEEYEIFSLSMKNYAFYYDFYFSRSHDPSLVRGQDNLQTYRPHTQISVRVQSPDRLVDLLRLIAASIICSTPLMLSTDDQKTYQKFQSLRLPPFISFKLEAESTFIERLERGEIKRMRVLSPFSKSLENTLANAACHLNRGEVMANGRLELLHFLREVSLSFDYHRYGNLAEREKEYRHPLPGHKGKTCLPCGACCCDG
ncbi:bifunctional proline dehydrogenase/L-glutamate gamma-semialdehyde dehydrogenase [Candidatus Protochlamydia amoebophila]|uniref:L-glutamate gamma-semialdehyde dehydrogenase n=1 Tax=Candidatus Protochlamydia amoebophila TaxID=362787 RepID=A0A0C1HIB2_9BACT|nr:bifunctional proline dehydrogenase/L-glutamate gamma-semialdehyde dehydrogenase [Candidatus Protochlamydia amoebophila]KIC74318.1 Bifunctional protein PutA [Candidatus Protochlamydia amoebophila]